MSYTVTVRKHLTLLLTIVLVVTMTGQSASAYILSCQGTASCCCIASQADLEMNGAMTGKMDRDCCTAGPSDPCDIEATSHAGAVPFLSGFVTPSVDRHLATGLTAPIIDPGDVAVNLIRHSEHFTDRDGPPVYLQTQHFLC